MFFNPVGDALFHCVDPSGSSCWIEGTVDASIIKVVRHHKLDVSVSFYDGWSQVLVTGDNQKVWALLKVFQSSLLMG